MKFFFRRRSAEVHSELADGRLLPIWSSDKCKTDGRQIFYTSSYADFRSYVTSIPFEHRHFYEILRPDVASHLYLDVEYAKTEANLMNLGDVSCAVNKIVLSAFSVLYHLLPDDVERVELDASNDSKYSRHLIYHVRSGRMFANPFHCGAFVRRLDFPRAEDESSVVDLGVYTQWRAFRLAGSSKMRDPSRPLLPWFPATGLTWENTLVQFPLCVPGPCQVLECYERDGYLPISGDGPKVTMKRLREIDVPHDLLRWIAAEIAVKWRISLADIMYSITYSHSRSMIFSSLSRFCAQKQSEHRANHVFFVVFIDQPRWRQGCHNRSRLCCFNERPQWSQWFDFSAKLSEGMKNFLF